MVSRVLAVAAMASVAASCSAANYWVSSTADSGPGTLRQAIANANANAGHDLIKVASALAGSVIVPVTPLPVVTDSGTVIDADVNLDGAPDLGISGKSLASANGLSVGASYCSIYGLAITNCPGYGIRMVNADFARIQACNFGINLAGTAQALCGYAELSLRGCDGCAIGGSTNYGNVFAGGARHQCGIELVDSNDNTIQGNYFAVTRDGTGVPGLGETGILLRRFAGSCSGNIIGGSRSSGQRNVFGRLGWGVVARGATSNRVMGNYFGLLPNGRTETDLSMASVQLDKDAGGNIIGGKRAGARNVIVGAGVEVLPGAGKNVISGNYFGFNAAGTRQRTMILGVHVASATTQTIGGKTEAAGNWFAGQGPSYRVTYGVALTGGGNSLVRYNHFGVRPDGRQTSGLTVGVGVAGVRARILDNLIANASRGIHAWEAGATPVIARNVIRHCTWAVSVEKDAQPCLGDLSDASSANDGGNFFRKSNFLFIQNLTPRRIKAENNDFGTTVRSEIDAKIYDRRDNPACGRVDYSPLAGGVLPTGGTLAVTGLAAAPTAAGAELRFTLSAFANVTVTVLNIAGRPVAMVMQDRETEAGLQRVLWSGHTLNGLRAPNGSYLMRVTARGTDGGQSTALAAVSLQ